MYMKAVLVSLRYSHGIYLNDRKKKPPSADISAECLKCHLQSVGQNHIA
jgi:hypothetical protein